MAVPAAPLLPMGCPGNRAGKFPSVTRIFPLWKWKCGNGSGVCAGAAWVTVRCALEVSGLMGNDGMSVFPQEKLSQPRVRNWWTGLWRSLILSLLNECEKGKNNLPEIIPSPKAVSIRKMHQEWNSRGNFLSLGGSVFWFEKQEELHKYIYI